MELFSVGLSVPCALCSIREKESDNRNMHKAKAHVDNDRLLRGNANTMMILFFGSTSEARSTQHRKSIHTHSHVWQCQANICARTRALTHTQWAYPSESKSIPGMCSIVGARTDCISFRFYSKFVWCTKRTIFHVHNHLELMYSFELSWICLCNITAHWVFAFATKIHSSAICK